MKKYLLFIAFLIFKISNAQKDIIKVGGEVGYFKPVNRKGGMAFINNLRFPLNNRKNIFLDISGGFSSSLHHDTTLVTMLDNKFVSNTKHYYSNWFFSPQVKYQLKNTVEIGGGPIVLKENFAHSSTRNVIYNNTDGSVKRIVPIQRTDYWFSTYLGGQVSVSTSFKLGESLELVPRLSYQFYTESDMNAVAATLGLRYNVSQNFASNPTKGLAKNELKAGLYFSNSDYSGFKLNIYQFEHHRQFRKRMSSSISIGILNGMDKEQSHSDDFMLPPFKTIVTGVFPSVSFHYALLNGKRNKIIFGIGPSVIFYKDVWRTIVSTIVSDNTGAPVFATTDDELYYERSDYEKNISFGYNGSLEYKHTFSNKVHLFARAQRQGFADYLTIHSIGLGLGYSF